MISTTTLQHPTNGFLTVKSTHASIVVGTMDSIVMMSLVIRIILHITRLSLKKSGTMLQVVVELVEDVLVDVAKSGPQQLQKEKAWSDLHCLCQS